MYAADNKEALEISRTRRFDLIVTGAKTSGKADVGLLRRLREFHPHTRLIILTDESMPEEVIAAMRERAFSYFTKPFSAETLLPMIKMAFNTPCWDDGIEVVSATSSWICLLARGDKDTADRLFQFVCEITDLPEAEKREVAFAFRELLLNAVEHGTRFDPEKYVEISYIRARHMVSCRVKDPGEGFSMRELHHAAIHNPSNDPLRHTTFRDAAGMRPGGFGILLAQNLVDELIYGEHGNDVLLIKYLHPDESRLSDTPRTRLSQAS
jgi:anti-sigma regulatory factor (Ser/Thr protein kinase)